MMKEMRSVLAELSPTWLKKRAIEKTPIQHDRIVRIPDAPRSFGKAKPIRRAPEPPRPASNM